MQLEEAGQHNTWPVAEQLLLLLVMMVVVVMVIAPMLFLHKDVPGET
jgi:hypothetical protein